MALILDTGPLLAAIDTDDPDHAACAELISQAEEPLVIPGPVLPELDYLLERQIGPEAMLAVLRDVVDGVVRVEDLTRDDYARVGELCERYADAGVGFVDAAVLTIAERLGEPKLATLDHRHFGLMRPGHIDALRLVP